MTVEELRALVERVWLGPAFTLEVVDATTVKVWVDVRAFWPGGPRTLTSTATLTEAMTPGDMVHAVQQAAGAALCHELEEVTTVDGKRWAPPHPVGRLRVDLTTTTKGNP